MLNYCCFGYSLPWYDWEQWERLIDWMALHGVNMPLSVTGQEAVWQGVGRRIGMSDTETAWGLLRETAYQSARRMRSAIDRRPTLKPIGDAPYDNARLVEAWRRLLLAANSCWAVGLPTRGAGARPTPNVRGWNGTPDGC